MTLEQAIKDLQDRIDGEFSTKGADDCADMNLGIEALKRTQFRRDRLSWKLEPLLPGETTE